MMSKIKISLSWSGGKDSAYALWKLIHDPQYEVVSLHTTLSEDNHRVGMHGIHVTLIEAQAASLGIRIDKVYFPASGQNKAYEEAISEYLNELQAEGVTHIAYGDILLEDLKEYREVKLAEKGFTAVFPLWASNTMDLAREFLSAGFKTKICAADADLIQKEWVGTDYSHAFLKQLTANVDPCGENGEFHSFCYDGPAFSKPISTYCKELVQRPYDLVLEDGTKRKKNFWFAELTKSDSEENVSKA
ncbi:MAG TPA: hypothetical protein VK014_13220 [Cyclobacteriaceae bacterium]|nr:hypothetical protein [Cyclobacteriaceae bacterium]